MSVQVWTVSWRLQAAPWHQKGFFFLGVKDKAMVLWCGVLQWQHNTQLRPAILMLKPCDQIEWVFFL